MAVKFKVAAKSEIPAGRENDYVERDGVMVLDVEGAVDKVKFDGMAAKVEEYRNNNHALKDEIANLKSRFDGINPDEVRKLADEKRKLEEAQQLKAGEVEKVVDMRVRAVRTELEKAAAALMAERDALAARLTGLEIDRAVVAEGTKLGLRPSAVPDLTARARQVFRLVGGAPQAFAEDGKTVLAGKDGLSPLTLAEWVTELSGKAPHLFEANAGGGAAGGGSGGAGGGGFVGNPFRKETWNVTEQMRLMKADPGLAARLQSVA